MPRLPRETFKGQSVFHVMVQGINKEKIFSKNREKFEYIKLIKEFKQEYEIKIIAYCIMDNHAHILLNTKEIENMTKFMHKINTSYGIYYNKNSKRVGYVFRNRFETQILKDISYLYNCILYIHNNPVKAGKCKYAKQYIFSSYYKFIDENEKIFKRLFKDKYEYELAHKEKNSKMYFIEEQSDRERKIIEEIREYLTCKNIHIAELKSDKNLLLPIALKLKNIYNLSNREIAKQLNVGRESIRNILK